MLNFTLSSKIEDCILAAKRGNVEEFTKLLKFCGDSFKNADRVSLFNALTIEDYAYSGNIENHLQIIQILLDDPHTSIPYTNKRQSLQIAKKSKVFETLFQHYCAEISDTDKGQILIDRVKLLCLESIRCIFAHWKDLITDEIKKQAIVTAANRQNLNIVNHIFEVTGIRKEDLDHFPNDNVRKIIHFIRQGNTKSAIRLINKASVEDLHAHFYYQLRNTTLFCEAALIKSFDIVQALFNRKVMLSPGESVRENIIFRLMTAANFDTASVPVGQLLVQNGYSIHYKNDAVEYSMLSDYIDESTDIFGNFVQNMNAEMMICKYQLLNKILGDAFFDELLFLSGKLYGKTPLYNVRHKCKNPGLYQFLLTETLSHFKARKNIPDHILTNLVLSTNNDKVVSEFVRRKLAERRNAAVPKQIQISNAKLINQHYSVNTQNFDPASSLFHFKNEIDAFRSQRSRLPLSIGDVCRVHDLSLRSDEEQGYATGLTRGGGIEVGDNCSLHAYFELKDCADKGWISFIPYSDSFNKYIICPPVSNEFLLALINEYNDDIKAIHHRVDKLKRIIKLASDLSRMHCFCDANKRTSYIVFNQELIKHHFLPANIKDRSIFRNQSQDELFPQVLDGMKLCLDALDLSHHEKLHHTPQTTSLLFMKNTKRPRTNELERLNSWYWCNHDQTTSVRAKKK